MKTVTKNLVTRTGGPGRGATEYWLYVHIYLIFQNKGKTLFKDNVVNTINDLPLLPFTDINELTDKFLFSNLRKDTDNEWL